MKNTLKNIKLVFLAMVLIFNIISIPFKAYAVEGQTTDIIINLDKQQYNAGEIVTVSLKSLSEAYIKGIQFQLNYDPAALSMQGDNIIPQGSYNTVIGNVGTTVDKSKGLLIYPLLNFTTSTANSSTEIAKVKFIAIKAGTTKINLSNIKAVDDKLNIVNNNDKSEKSFVVINSSAIPPVIPPIIPPTEVTVPVVTKTDENLNVIATIDSSKVNNNAKNIIQINEPKADSKVQVQIPTNSITNGTGSFEIQTGSVSLDIPNGIIDSSMLSIGSNIQITKSIMSETDSNGLLANIPQSTKTNGKIFTFGMAIYDSNNNWVSYIHNFANNKSVTVTINLTDNDIKGMDTSKISAFYFDESSKKWVEIGGNYDASKMAFTFNTTHFTNFAIMQKSSVTSQRNVQRLAGASRIETSLAIAMEQYSDKKPDAVVLATANDFPDALAGSGLAYKYNAPMLLVYKSVNDSKKVLDYITTNLSKGKNIYLLGETGVVSKEISDYLASQGYNIIRLGGKDRYETNQKIVDYLNMPKGTSLVITTGDDFADALSVSSIADIKGFPILLNGKDNVSIDVSNYITNSKPTTIYLIGGIGVLSANIETQIKNLNGNINIVRLGGLDRYETSIKIAEYFNLNTLTFTLAIGDNYPDALSGSVLAARNNSSVLLVDNKDITKQKDLIDKKEITKVIVLGGEGVISKNIADSFIKK